MSSSQPEVTIILGTRPEIIKLAPVIRECETRDLPYTLLHTGQHYSEELDEVFFDQLELPTPDYNLQVGSKSHGQQTADMIAGIEELLLEESPDIVLVQGDTNSVLAGAIAASKLDIVLGHVEAGLRSFDREMPEEVNRVLADHVAEYLFAPTDQSREYLREEGIDDEQIHVTGNTMVDAVHEHRELAAEKSTILREFELSGDQYGLMTAHRAENVDDPERFSRLLEGVSRGAAKFDFEVVYPIHPRAENRIEEFSLPVPDRVRLVEPQDYLDFLKLEANAELILTDSGGVQEEACLLGVPCVTLRDNTERPETLRVGANELAGVDQGEIAAAADRMLSTDNDWQNPFGDGTTAEQIIEILSADIGGLRG
jgi:UDP-N-acetylglucosamine 2-epimerase (non-hydrolysing)